MGAIQANFNENDEKKEPEKPLLIPLKKKV